MDNANTDRVGEALRLSATPYTRPTVGALRSHVAGRTDHLGISVPGESFVIPADVVSGLGEGNTENGFHILNTLFNLPHADAPPAIHHLKQGGTAHGDQDGVPILAAGGEFVIPPETIAQIGGGDLKRGHQILRSFVQHVRKKTIDKLKSLPEPHR